MAAEPVKVVVRAARHAAWWLRYQLHGQTHPAPQQPRGKRAGSGE